MPKSPLEFASKKCEADFKRRGPIVEKAEYSPLGRDVTELRSLAKIFGVEKKKEKKD